MRSSSTNHLLTEVSSVPHFTEYTRLKADNTSEDYETSSRFQKRESEDTEGTATTDSLRKTELSPLKRKPLATPSLLEELARRDSWKNTASSKQKVRRNATLQ